MTILACLVLVVLSGTFAMFSIVMSSEGTNISALQSNNLVQLLRDVQNLDGSYTNAYQRYVAGEDALRDRACHGDDQTGIHICGAIANGYASAANKARAAFGPVLGAVTARADYDASDMGATWSEVESELAGLRAKAKAFDAFADERTSLIRV